MRRNSWIGRLARLVRHRLVLPMTRSPHPPEHTARGVAVGMAWAMTPTVGLQMYFVLMTWLFARRVLNWDFSLINGLAWTWTTNVFTMLPCYYVFYVTGQLMLGRFDDLSGFAGFVDLWQATFSGELDWWAQAGVWFDVIVKGWGLSMLIGSLPWAALCAWLGYRLALRFVRHRRRVRGEKMARAREAAPKRAPPLRPAQDERL